MGCDARKGVRFGGTLRVQFSLRHGEGDILHRAISITEGRGLSIIFERVRSEQMEKVKLAHLANRNRKRDPEGTAMLNSQAIFKALLRHERSRSDRDGSEFSLAVFDVAGMISNGRGIQQIVSHIREKMRSTDEIGWLNDAEHRRSPSGDKPSGRTAVRSPRIRVCHCCLKR